MLSPHQELDLLFLLLPAPGQPSRSSLAPQSPNRLVVFPESFYIHPPKHSSSPWSFGRNQRVVICLPWVTNPTLNHFGQGNEIPSLIRTRLHAQWSWTQAVLYPWMRDSVLLLEERTLFRPKLLSSIEWEIMALFSWEPPAVLSNHCSASAHM